MYVRPDMQPGLCSGLTCHTAYPLESDNLCSPGLVVTEVTPLQTHVVTTQKTPTLGHWALRKWGKARKGASYPRAWASLLSNLTAGVGLNQPQTMRVQKGQRYYSASFLILGSWWGENVFSWGVFTPVPSPGFGTVGKSDLVLYQTTGLGWNEKQKDRLVSPGLAGDTQAGQAPWPQQRLSCSSSTQCLPPGGQCHRQAQHNPQDPISKSTLTTWPFGLALPTPELLFCDHSRL